MHVLLIDDDGGSLLGMQIAIECLGHTCNTYTDPRMVVQHFIGQEDIKQCDSKKYEEMGL